MNALSPDSLPAFDEVVKDAGLGKDLMKAL